MTHSLEDILAAQHLTLTSEVPTAREGEVMRYAVHTESGERALLYLWPTTDGAARAIRALVREDLGGQLFAVPDVFAHNASQRWCVVAQPEGESLADWLKAQGVHHFGQLPAQIARPIVDSLGVLLRKLHSITSPGLFGEIPDDLEALPEGTFHTFNGWVASKLERFADAINQAQNLTPEERLLCLEYLGDLRHELSAFHPRHPAVFSHGSLGVEHLWIGAGGQEIVGLTGFDRVRYVPAEADLASVMWIEGLATLDDAIIRSFYRGYGAAHTMDVQRRERFYRRLTALDVLAHSIPTRRQLDTATLIALAGPHVNPA